MSPENITSNGYVEHVLVCLSPSPTNRKIIEEAAGLVHAFHAQFTALYVSKSQEETLHEAEHKRLHNNIRLAEDLGATITTVIGDDIPFQIAEFARISGVTKIVIGRSNIKRYHIWEKQTLTEQLIAIAPDIDIYIIPDSKADIKENNKRTLPQFIVPTAKDLVITAGTLVAVTCLGLVFSKQGFTEANIITVYILGVLLNAIFTRSHVCSLISSLSSVLLFNYFFTEPRFTFHAYEPGYSVTFVIMLVASLLTGSLAFRLKDSARESARSAYKAKVLFDTNQLLQKSRTYDDVLKVIANQVILLLDKDVIIYPVENNELGAGYAYARNPEESAIGLENAEPEVVNWVLKNKKRAGATTKVFRKARCLYLAIRINGTVYGIMGIRVEKKALSSFEYSVLMSILGEGALALENLDNEKAKEEATLVAQKEKLRANILRTISHDLRTPLTSISGNASTLCNNYEMLDDATRQQMFSDIYDDSEWLIQLVENLLSVTRIENGQMQLNKALESFADVIDESLKHIDRNKTEHKIKVDHPDDLIIVNMDAKLITQVIINIVNNAIKYTQAGSTIEIKYGIEGQMVYVRIADDGPGMDDKTKEHAFDMFYTGQNRIADGKRSMGIGLALCRSVVEAHGGSIEVTDNKPSGCIFTLYLEKGDVAINE